MAKVNHQAEAAKLIEENYSITAQCPFANHISPNRNFMAASHIEQSLELLHPEPKIVRSGLEKELGKNTFSVQVDRDCTVEQVIERTELRSKSSDIVEMIIIVKDDQGYYDYYHIPYYFTLGTSFGFKYVSDIEFLRSLRYGDKLTKGTILADSGAVVDDDFTYGLNANVAMLSIQDVAEDGMIVSKSFSDKLTYRMFKKTEITFGSGSYPLNLYGDKDNYIPFPPIGSTVREDGILCALRKFNQEEVMYTTSIEDLMQHDKELDIRYVTGKGGTVTDHLGMEHLTGKVVDVRVIKNDSKIKPRQDMYALTLGEIERHADTTLSYYKSIVDYYNQLNKTKDTRVRYGNRPENPLKLRERFWNLISRALVLVNKDGSKISTKIPLTYKTVEQDIYIVTIVTEHIIKSGVGGKLSNCYGY